VKFQGSQSLPPHQNRRLQLRMLGFVTLIGLVLFAAQAWRIGSGRPETPRPDAQNRKSIDDIDFGVNEEPDSRLKPDEFRIAPRRQTRRAETDDAQDTPAAEGRTSVIIPSRWLAEVQDNTVGIRQNESDAYYRVLAKLPTVPPRELQAQAEREALFVNLMTSPERYRGRPVRITGELRKLYDIPRAKNDYGVPNLYEAWICTAESGENPYRVVCREIPPELKPQESARIDVKVTGYFFKREGYLTQDGRLHVAPTILADRISLYIPPQAPPPVEDVVPWMVGVISVIGLAMLATVIGYAVGDSRRRKDPPGENLSTADLHRFSAADRRLSVEESLRRLEEHEWLDDEAEEFAQEEFAPSGNGHVQPSDLPDELIDLPTPFPPTRTPRRFEPPN
jgi:hypothetical protein